MPKKKAAAPVLEKVTVHSSTVIHSGVGASRTIEVKGIILFGRKRVPREYTVTFNRRKEIDHGYQYVPEIGYMPPSMIPAAVVSAAVAAYEIDLKNQK